MTCFSMSGLWRIHFSLQREGPEDLTLSGCFCLSPALTAQGQWDLRQTLAGPAAINMCPSPVQCLLCNE